MARKRVFALLLVAVMSMAVLSACGSDGGGDRRDDQVMVIGVDSRFDEKWNPFIVETAYDHQSVDQVFAAVSYINFDNELEDWAGSIKTEQQSDGGVLYTITINRDMTFSDGTPVTIDDYIYGLYVRSDPSYIGKPGAMHGEYIEGMNEYVYDDPNYSAKLAEIEKTASEEFSTDNITYENFLIYAEETDLDGWWDGEASDYWTDYIEEEGYGDELAAIDPTNDRQVFELVAKIEYDNYLEYYDTENWYLNTKKLEFALGNLEGGVNVPAISGIKRIDDYTCTVKYTRINIYADRGLATRNGCGNLIPKHYYGEFEKGDVSAILSNMSPMGSGPYIWGGFADNIITCTANPTFFKGEPKTKTVRWQYVPNADLLPSLAAGDIDICNPTGNKTNVAQLKEMGTRYDMIDNAGYGYMGMNTQSMSLDVRRGIWCLMNRQPSVEGYYGDIAKVIERPMTTTLAEYPKDAKAYYPVSTEEALKYFEKAGYTKQGGKLVDSGGNQLVVNCYIVGDGTGDHPAFAMLVQAAGDMKALGGEIQIQDVPFPVLNSSMNDGTADMWIMAWTAVYDCDKSSQFHSTGGQNRYRFYDPKMDGMLEEITQTVDLDERRELVSEMLDWAMENCLEFPLYQRKNIIAYNSVTLNGSTIPVATTACDYEQFLYLVEMAGN